MKKKAQPSAVAAALGGDIPPIFSLMQELWQIDPAHFTANSTAGSHNKILSYLKAVLDLKFIRSIPWEYRR